MINIAELLIPHIGESKHEKDVPVEHQLPILGLEGKVLRSLRGKRVLDLACGKGQLVNYLRDQGVLADGIDPRAPEQPWFTRRKIESIGPERGIPAAPNTYDVITSFQNVCFNMGIGNDVEPLIISLMGGNERAQAVFNRYCDIARFMLSEIGRTLKVGGRAIIYPQLIEAEERVGHLLRLDKLKVYREEIKNGKALARYMSWEGERDPKHFLGENPLYKSRMVLEKGK